MYNYINDPKTKYKINIRTNSGRRLVYNYITYILNQKGGNNNYFNINNILSKKKKKFCRCILHVSKKNTNNCNKNRDWNTPGCYNPYKVCASSTGTTTGSKTCSYNFLSSDIPEDEINSYIALNNDKFKKCNINSRKDIQQCYQKI